MRSTWGARAASLAEATGAARDGITLTRFVEDALRARLMDVGSTGLPVAVGDRYRGRATQCRYPDRDALYDVIGA